MIVGRWYARFLAYLPLWIHITIIFVSQLSVHSFFFNLVSINFMECQRYQHVLTLCALVTGVILKGTNLLLTLPKICVYVYMYVLCLCRDWFCGLT